MQDLKINARGNYGAIVMNQEWTLKDLQEAAGGKLRRQVAPHDQGYE